MQDCNTPIPFDFNYHKQNSSSPRYLLALPTAGRHRQGGGCVLNHAMNHLRFMIRPELL